MLGLKEPLESFKTSLGQIAVDGFFVISGYLLWSSALTQNPNQFILIVLLELFPA
jgi:peptidoglycan/LPS O-acetylase OafA/YrhL